MTVKSAYPKALLLLVLCLSSAVNVLASNEKQQQIAAIEKLVGQPAGMSSTVDGCGLQEYHVLDSFRTLRTFWSQR
jgi:hypothetical protein